MVVKSIKLKNVNFKNSMKFVSVVLVLPLVWLLLHGSGIALTFSGSIPVGFYHIVKKYNHLDRGEYISFCLPKKIAQIGLARGYIQCGGCPDGSEELVKKIIAVPGDVVKITGNEIIVTSGGINVQYLAPTNVMDKNNFLVKRFIESGKHIAKGYWVYGFNNVKYSWDSRYYGEIMHIRHKLVPMLTVGES